MNFAQGLPHVCGRFMASWGIGVQLLKNHLELGASSPPRPEGRQFLPDELPP